ncbi:MAG: SIS domain-containing protein [Candidatus Kryptoniota bacterium]
MNKFIGEIMDQPDSLAATLDFYCTDIGEKKLKKIQQIVLNGDIREIIFAGMGSSYFTSYAGACLLNELGIRSQAINASELLYYHFSLLNNNTLLTLISQSGESFEVVKLIEKVSSDIKVIGISNEDGSSLTKRAAEVLLSRAGREESTSTKTYTSMMLAMFILGWYLSGHWNSHKVTAVKKLVTDIREFLKHYESDINELMDFLGELEFIQFIGRGPSFATAQQSELMFKEAARLAASATLGGEFRHGPMEMINSNFKCVVFAAGETYQQSVRMARDIARYGGKVVLITNRKLSTDEKNVKVIQMDQSNEYLFTIQSIVPMQLLVNHLAISKGVVPGVFVNGSKITLTE